jgi:hypothetical protein
MFDEPGKPWSGFSTAYARARAMQVEHEMEKINLVSQTPVAGEITTVKAVLDANGNPVEVREVKYEDMLGHRRLQVDTMKWRIAKLARNLYGDGVSADAPPDESLKVEGGLPEPGEPGHASPDEPE